MTLATRNPAVVSWIDWQKINDAETARGKAAGRPRAKLTSIAEMLGAR